MGNVAANSPAATAGSTPPKRAKATAAPVANSTAITAPSWRGLTPSSPACRSQSRPDRSRRSGVNRRAATAGPSPAPVQPNTTAV